MAKNTITEINPWVSPQTGEVRIYVKAGRKEGVLYRDGNPWHEKGSTEGSLSPEQWDRVKELGVVDGRWRKMNEGGIARRSQDLSRTDEQRARMQAKRKAALGPFGDGMQTPSEKQVKYAQSLQARIRYSWQFQPYIAPNLANAAGVYRSGMSRQDAERAAQGAWEKAMVWYGKMDVSQMSRKGISKFIDMVSGSRYEDALAAWYQAQGSAE